MGKLDGSCLCGQVTYSCDAEPIVTAVCHCRDCQRQTSSAFSILVAVPADAFELRGATVSSYVTVGEDTGQETERRFCTACGSPIVSVPAAPPGIVYIKAGTLDDVSWLEPQASVWCDSAQPWVPIDEGHPHFGRGVPQS
jgi:hypothetical protein